MEDRPRADPIDAIFAAVGPEPSSVLTGHRVYDFFDDSQVALTQAARVQ